MSTDTQFKAGNKSKGRPKGARNKFSHAWVKAFNADFAEHGPQVIEKVRETKPEAYLKVASQLVPKDLDVKHSGDVTVNVVDYKDDD